MLKRERDDRAFQAGLHGRTLVGDRPASGGATITSLRARHDARMRRGYH